MPRATTRQLPTDAYVPTLEAAAKAGLLPPGREPYDVQPLCALVVLVRLLSRRQWREEKVLSWGSAKRMNREPPSVPDTPRSANYICLEETFETKRCGVCAANPDANEACTKCQVRGRILHTADSFATMFETYLPAQVQVPAMFSFESMLERRTTPGGQLPPAALECHDLKPQRSGGAYRSARTSKDPVFRGHAFSDTIETASEAIEKFFLGKDATRFDIRAWAWPFLWLRYGEMVEAEERALFVDHEGKLDMFVGLPPD
jgi:hypothetical protein